MIKKFWSANNAILNSARNAFHNSIKANARIFKQVSWGKVSIWSNAKSVKTLLKNTKAVIISAVSAGMNFAKSAKNPGLNHILVNTQVWKKPLKAGEGAIGDWPQRITFIS